MSRFLSQTCGSVELAAARTIIRSPVIYVRNILKYYVTYRLYQDRIEGLRQ